LKFSQPGFCAAGAQRYASKPIGGILAIYFCFYDKANLRNIFQINNKPDIGFTCCCALAEIIKIIKSRLMINPQNHSISISV
jgi:hypothetical protein